LIAPPRAICIACICKGRVQREKNAARHEPLQRRADDRCAVTAHQHRRLVGEADRERPPERRVPDEEVGHPRGLPDFEDRHPERDECRAMDTAVSTERP
jgi:hypothetical protein